MRTILLLFLLACLGSADPRIREDEYDVLDVASLKAGEWTEMSSDSEFTKADGTKEQDKRIERLACVKADDEFVWIEDTRPGEEKDSSKVVTLTQVRRKDRRSVKAWFGKPGGEGADLKLSPARTEKRAAPPGTKTTATVEKEITRAGSREIETQKITITTVEKKGAEESKTTMTLWCTADGPFRFRLDDASVREGICGPATWDSTPTCPLSAYRIESDHGTWTDTTTVTDHGTDAKPTLTVK